MDGVLTHDGQQRQVAEADGNTLMIALNRLSSWLRPISFMKDIF